MGRQEKYADNVLIAKRFMAAFSDAVWSAKYAPYMVPYLPPDIEG
jgi:hypothetical protein